MDVKKLVDDIMLEVDSTPHDFGWDDDAALKKAIEGKIQAAIEVAPTRINAHLEPLGVMTVESSSTIGEVEEFTGSTDPE